ncbi:MAG: hypothetical protein U1F43_34110 [Myxococcota bacterium]
MTFDALNQIGAVDTQSFLLKAQQLGLPVSAQQQLLGLLIFEQLGKVRRSFDYSSAVADKDPTCAPAFARSFQHVDWTDGESVVQAEQTSGEDGFNLRFHRIEADLDALAADTRKTFECLAELRAQLAQALADVKAELNLINGDVYACCNKGSATTINPGTVIPWDPIIIPQPTPHTPYIPFPLPNGGLGPLPTGPLVNPNPMGPGVWNWLTGQSPGTWVLAAGGANAQPATLGQDPRPVDAFISGMPATFVRRQPFLGRDRDVWSTPAGFVVTEPSGEVPRRAYRDPLVDRVEAVASWSAAAAPKVKAKFPAGFTVEELAREFGDDDVGGGRTLASIIASLPRGVRGPGNLIEASVADGLETIKHRGGGELLLATSLNWRPGRPPTAHRSARWPSCRWPRVTPSPASASTRSASSPASTARVSSERWRAAACRPPRLRAGERRRCW